MGPARSACASWIMAVALSACATPRSAVLPIADYRSAETNLSRNCSKRSWAAQMGPCPGEDRAVVAYGIPSPRARGGVITYDPWYGRSFPVTPSGSTWIASLEGAVTVECPRDVPCDVARDGVVSLMGRDGQRVELVVRAPGYESVRVPIVLGDKGPYRRLVLLPPKEAPP